MKEMIFLEINFFIFFSLLKMWLIISKNVSLVLVFVKLIIFSLGLGILDFPISFNSYRKSSMP